MLACVAQTFNNKTGLRPLYFLPMKKEPIYGEDLATEIILKLRRNQFKTMSDEQIEKFRLAMAYYLDLKNL